MYEEKQRCEKQEKSEQDVNRGKVQTDEGWVEGECWEKSDGGESADMRRVKVRESFVKGGRAEVKENGLALSNDEKDEGRSVKEMERDGGDDDVKHVLGRFLSRGRSIPLQSVL